MTKKKIALVTCYFQPNYGSQLQAFATQEAFVKLGLEHETIMIDGLLPEINKAKYKYFLSKILDVNTVKDKMATVRKLLIKENGGSSMDVLCYVFYHRVKYSIKVVVNTIKSWIKK